MPDDAVDKVVGGTAAGLSVAALVATVGRRRRAFRPDPDWEPADVPGVLVAGGGGLPGAVVAGVASDGAPGSLVAAAGSGGRP